MSAAAAPGYQPVVPEPPRGPRRRSAAKPTPAPPRRDQGARLAPPPAPVTAPRTPFVMLVLALVAAGIVGLLVLNTKINENSFRLEGLRDRQASLEIREQQLRSDLDARQTPGNLTAAARMLGLVRDESPAFLYLPDGRVVEVPQPDGGDPTDSGG